ncbi:MAG: hypothetical protein OXM61_08320 [Candidatus Poribacteria bacterium]|nr:hypothetical protein [Candidatus Poribacteria bacterium]
MYFDFRNLCVFEKHYVSWLGKTIDDLYEEDLPEVITWYPPLSYMTFYLAYPSSGKDAEDITWLFSQVKKEN